MKFFQFMLVMVVMAAPVWAQPRNTSASLEQDGQDWVLEEEGVLSAGQRLRISAIGRVVVTGAQTQDVRYRAEKRIRARSESDATALLRPTRVEARKSDDTVAVSMSGPACNRCRFRAELELLVPVETTDAIVYTEAGTIEITGLNGRVNAESAAGGIQLEQIAGDVRALTAGGHIELGSIGGTVRCETAGGSIRVEQALGDAILTTSGGSIEAEEVVGRLQAETAGGSIRVETAGSEAYLATSGGTILMGRAGGPVTAETAGGSIKIASALQGVHAETAGGDVYLRNIAGKISVANAAGNIHAYLARGKQLETSHIETNAGTIVVWIPDSLQVTIEAVVEFADRLNRIQTDFETITVRREGESFGPGSVLAVGELNGGGPVLRLSNLSGGIQIRRLQ